MIFPVRDWQLSTQSGQSRRAEIGQKGTPENLNLGGFWARVGATLIDAVILTVISAPLLIAFYGTEYFTDPYAPAIAGVADVLISYVLPAVAIVLFWLYKRATPGKMAVSAQVVDAETGNALTTGQAVGRYFAYILSSLPLGLGLVWTAFDARKQGWHDKLAGTVVVRQRS